MAKDSFILYLDQQEIFEMLTDEQAGQLIKNIFLYERTGQMPKMDKMLTLAFVPIMQILDKNRRKYDEKCKKNKENVEKRWNKNNAVVYERKKTNTNYTDNDNESDNDNDNESEIIKKKKIKRKTFEDIFAENKFDEDLETALKDFIDMRKTIKKPMTTKALELLIKNLEKLTNLEEEKIAILNQSIEHGWQTVYPLKSGFSQSGSKGSINDFKELMEEARAYDERGNNTGNNTFGW